MIRVLIADDHTIVREGLQYLIEKHEDIKVIGYAKDGRQTVYKVQKLQPDVVVMDIAMPELNGIEATRKVRQTCASTQVVILSMYGTNEHVFLALQAGALGYLLKESAGIEVVNAIRAAHSGHRYICKKVDEAMVDNYIRRRKFAVVKSPLESLSQREREILQLVVEGKSSAEIASSFSLSPKTVETYRSRLMFKLHVSDVPSLVKFAIQHGLTRPE